MIADRQEINEVVNYFGVKQKNRSNIECAIVAFVMPMSFVVVLSLCHSLTVACENDYVFDQMVDLSVERVEFRCLSFSMRTCSGCRRQCSVVVKKPEKLLDSNFPTKARYR